MRFKFISQMECPNMVSASFTFYDAPNNELLARFMLQSIAKSPSMKQGILIARKRDLHAGPQASFVKRRH